MIMSDGSSHHGSESLTKRARNSIYNTIFIRHGSGTRGRTRSFTHVLTLLVLTEISEVARERQRDSDGGLAGAHQAAHRRRDARPSRGASIKRQRTLCEVLETSCC